jgi:hypothetical protein
VYRSGRRESGVLVQQCPSSAPTVSC